MSIKKLLIFCFVFISLIPLVSSLNASSSNYWIKGSLGSLSTNGSSPTYNLFASNPNGPVSNLSNDGTYPHSWLQFFGPNKFPEIGLDYPINTSSLSSFTFVFNWSYNSTDDEAWLECYAELNGATNLTFPCNDTNVTMDLNSSYDEQWNTLELFITDSINQTNNSFHTFWLNISTGGDEEEEGGGGGGGGTTYNPITRPSVDPFTNETLPSGYQKSTEEYMKEYVQWTIEAIRAVLKETGESIIPQNAALGLGIVFSIIVLYGYLYKKSGTFFGWLYREKEDEDNQRYNNIIKKQEEGIKLTIREKAFKKIYERKIYRNVPKSTKSKTSDWGW